MLLSSWLTVASICALGAMSPGPSLAVVMNNTVNHGRGAGMLTALGHGLGVTAYALVTALGLAVLIAESPGLFVAIRWLGAAFLLYLAWRSFTAASAPTDAETSLPQAGHASFTAGLLISVLNPKLAVFFLALFSQFVAAGAPAGDKLLLALTAGVIDTLWYLLVAWGLANEAVLAWLRRHQQLINRCFAAVIALLALSIVLRG